MGDVDVYTDWKFPRIIKPSFIGGFAMGKFIDRTGQRFGKLVVVERMGSSAAKKVLWRCSCDCGGEVTVPSGSLVTGNTQSCGCIIPNFKHGGTGKGSYNTWRAMMRRCYKQEDKDYPRYGGKGVTVHQSWHDYETFAKNVGEPKNDETLDRINTYGNYEPGNCRWASVQVQNRNIRIREKSKSGVIGVRIRNGGWYAEITVKRKKYYSKVARSLEEAIQNRKELERIHWGNS